MSAPHEATPMKEGGEADATPSPPADRTRKQRMCTFIEKRWFEMGMVIVILIAYGAPEVGRKGGFLASQITVSYVAVPVTFLLSGMSLKTAQLLAAAKMWRTHLVVQSMIFATAPAFMFAVASLLRLSSMDPLLVDGLIICGSVPCTISMANIITEASKGNMAVSLFNTTFANLLGVVVTPALLFLFFTKDAGSGDVGKVLRSLALTLLLPVVAGQILSYVLGPQRLACPRKYFGKINKAILLFIVFCTFCTTFARDALLAPESLAGMFAVVLTCLLCLTAFNFWVFRLPCLGLSRRDQVAALLCGSQKTVAAGIPLINIVYAGNPNIGVIVIPLLMYHPSQLVLGSSLVGWFGRYVDAEVPAGPEADVEAVCMNVPAGPEAGAEVDVVL